jgi:hypothetical protein
VFASDSTEVIVDINGYFGPAAPPGLSFYSVRPCRVADTRVGSGLSGAFGAPSIPGGTFRDFPIPSSACGIPPTALAYSLNMTAVPPGPMSYLSVWPASQPQPLVSTLNAFDGRIVANAAIVPAGANGAIRAFVSERSDLVIDINGYFALPGSPGALSLYLFSPCRVADTRTGSGFTGAFGPPALAGGAVRDFPLATSGCGLPASAQAYSLNMTVVPFGPVFYLSVWPAGQPQPLVSTLNSFQGKVVANAALVPAGANGAISVFSPNSTHLVMDVNGYFAP